jgi:hemerythrin-like domain-containing protein
MSVLDESPQRAYERLNRQRREQYLAGDPTAMLMVDHEWLRAALAELRQRALSGVEAAEFAEVVGLVWQVVDEHSRLEEELYLDAVDEALSRHGRQNPMVQAMKAEHDALPDRYRQLQAALSGQGDVVRALDGLTRALLVHFDNEEDLVFQEAQEVVTGETGRGLAQAMARWLGLV